MYGERSGEAFGIEYAERCVFCAGICFSIFLFFEECDPGDVNVVAFDDLSAAGAVVKVFSVAVGLERVKADVLRVNIMAGVPDGFAAVQGGNGCHVYDEGLPFARVDVVRGDEGLSRGRYVKLGNIFDVVFIVACRGAVAYGRPFDGVRVNIIVLTFIAEFERRVRVKTVSDEAHEFVLLALLCIISFRGVCCGQCSRAKRYYYCQCG